MSLTPIQQIRLTVQDNTPGLYIISDDEIQYLLEKNNNNVDKASYQAAKIILLNLSQRNDETVDILSIKSSKAAEAYRLALELFIKDPNNNPLYSNLKGWFGGVSRSEMEENDANPDNNAVRSPTQDRLPYEVIQGSTFWSIVNP